MSTPGIYLLFYDIGALLGYQKGLYLDKLEVQAKRVKCYFHKPKISTKGSMSETSNIMWRM